MVNPESKVLQMYVMASGLSGIMITITTLMTVCICGPLAVNIAGTLKDVGLTYVGFIFFDDVTLTESVAVGLTLSFAGASYFVYDKWLE